MARRFILIKDNCITGDYVTNKPENIPGYSILTDGELKEVSENFSGLVGESMDLFSGEERKSLETLVSEKLVTLADDEEIKDNRIVKKVEPIPEPTLTEIKSQYVEMLSGACYFQREKILSDKKCLNILVGAPDYYPAYLKGDTGKENVRKLFKIYQDIYKTYAVELYAAESKEAVKNIFDAVVWPSENEILTGLGVA